MTRIEPVSPATRECLLGTLQHNARNPFPKLTAIFDVSGSSHLEYWPVGRLADGFCKLVGRSYLNTRHIDQLRDMGFQVELRKSSPIDCLRPRIDGDRVVIGRVDIEV